MPQKVNPLDWGIKLNDTEKNAPLFLKFLICK